MTQENDTIANCSWFFLNFVPPESLQADVLQLKKENLLLMREKLQLQISLLKHKLSKLELEEWQLFLFICLFLAGF